MINLMEYLPFEHINIISLQVLLEQGNWASLSFILEINSIQHLFLKQQIKWLARLSRKIIALN
ncbi:hypothetical protein CXF59_01480 [Flavobacterium sp. ALD4]|nr:hypothetical protein CXF59_01480 [Flavobacterium sp. ALD4]